MQKLIFLLLILFLSSCCTKKPSFEEDKKDIVEIMEKQAADWSNGDLEEFMEGYWKSDSLGFMGLKGIRYGWQATLDSYKRGYPDLDAMGKLSFKYDQFKQMGDKNMFLAGQWKLERSKDTIGGYLTLVWEKIDGEWKVIFDHTP